MFFSIYLIAILFLGSLLSTLCLLRHKQRKARQSNGRAEVNDGISDRTGMIADESVRVVELSYHNEEASRDIRANSQ